MDFSETFSVVSKVLKNIGSDLNELKYDGMIVKRLEVSNTLDKGRTTNQSHIAITGSQMNMFPYLRADGYFTENYNEQDSELKKYLVAQIPTYLHKENVDYLGSEEKLFEGDTLKVYISIVRSRRNGAPDQIQMFMERMDSPEYKSYRKLVHAGSYMIMLKRKEEFEYDLYCVKPDDSHELESLNNVFVKLPTNTAVKIDEMSETKRSTKLIPASNILLYGVPGCGKSHTIKKQYCDDNNFMERVVFHPDYTYSDFIGQILPKVTDHKVFYEFEPGPFTSILKKAVKNKDSYYYLIIEEINRGNAPAIFGDVFQLLDRDGNGESEYGISNETVAEEVYGDKGHEIRIPSNLYILATMNSSDQNVFTLDTAFKRRWKMKLIENDIDACVFASHSVCGSAVTWSAFVKRINDLIIEVKTDNFSNEDNRLGAYFVSESELNDAGAFGEKVLMYLWNDAFKYDHDKVFKPQYRTLDELVKGFKQTGFDVFADNVKFSKNELSSDDE